jgi:hypothetical protein
VIGARNVKGGLVILSLGLLAGLGTSLYAFVPVVSVPAWLLEYDDLSRRLLRLAHIAAIMLPLLNIVLGAWLDRLVMPAIARRVASWLLLVGSAAVPTALAVEAVWPPARTVHLAATPVVGFCLGVFVVSLGACRTQLAAFEREMAPAAPRGRPPAA